MIELTGEQRRILAQQQEVPPRANNPDTQITYVLIKEEVYDRVKSLFVEEEEGQVLRDMYSHAMEVFGRDGWDDPAMDVYNELDPRSTP